MANDLTILDGNTFFVSDPAGDVQPSQVPNGFFHGDMRHLSTWLSPGDLGRLVRACLTSPDLGFAILYGVSDNSRGWWDLDAGRRLGYEPRDDAEVFAAEVEPAEAGAYQGGPKFTDEGTTP